MKLTLIFEGGGNGVIRVRSGRYMDRFDRAGLKFNFLGSFRSETASFFSRFFPQQPSGLGFQSLNTDWWSQLDQFWRRERRQYEKNDHNIDYSFFLFSIFFPSQGPRRQYEKKLNYVFLRAFDGQCHRGSIKKLFFFFFFSFSFFFPNSLQAWGSNLLTRTGPRNWINFGNANGGSMKKTITTSFTHFICFRFFPFARATEVV